MPRPLAAIERSRDIFNGRTGYRIRAGRGDVAVFDMPAPQRKVCPPNYCERNFLQPDRVFAWPRAPRNYGGHRVLRTTPDEVFGHYAAPLLAPALDVGYVSTSN